MGAFIDPPKTIPFYLRPGIWIANRIAGRDLLPAKLLAWYPPVAVSSGVLEALIVHHDRHVNERMLKLVRLQASYALACPFCIDMNSVENGKYGVTEQEIAALQGRIEIDAVETFSAEEKVAVKYARLISLTPLSFPPEFIETLKKQFTERDIVILASTAAQVNYWSRLIQALGIPPMGYSDQCAVTGPAMNR